MKINPNMPNPNTNVMEIDAVNNNFIFYLGYSKSGFNRFYRLIQQF
jgi:hypothetical protein